jgi:hypothetical protein
MLRAGGIRRDTCAVRSFAEASRRGLDAPGHTSAYVSIRQHTSTYVSIRYTLIRQHTSAYVSMCVCVCVCARVCIYGGAALLLSTWATCCKIMRLSSSAGALILPPLPPTTAPGVAACKYAPAERKCKGEDTQITNPHALLFS